jgi:predicted DNA-binding protein with PD1-like motif
VELRGGRIWLVRIPQGSDLWDWIRDFARENDVRAGSLTLIGAVTRAVISFYDQEGREYVDREIEGPHEIVSCTGNLSIHEGGPFPHVHIVLGAEDGRCVGGHLRPGTVVFAGEAEIREATGGEPERAPDPGTGLPLWKR